MAINLKKISRDVQQEDEDIRTLALTTAAQLQPSSVEQVKDLDLLCLTLDKLSQGPEDDLVFLARKALNHLRSIRSRVKGADAEPLPVLASGAVGVVRRTRAELLIALQREAEAVPLATTVKDLGQVGTAEDVETLKPFLGHDDPRVRGNAVEAVERLADEKTLTALLSPMFRDPNNRVRGNVAKALGKIGYPRILEIVREMTSMGNLRMYESAVWAMSFIKGQEMIEMLVQALDNSYEGIRLRGVQGLAQHKDPTTLTALRKMFADVDADVAAAARNAVQIITEGKPTLFEQEILDLSTIPVAPSPGETPAAASPAPSDQDELGNTPMSKEDMQSAANSLLADVAAVRVPNLEGRSADDLRRLLATQMDALATHLKELIHRGVVSEEKLNRFYYDILKYQEFLKKHQEQEANKTPDGILSAIRQSLKEGLTGKTPAIARLEQFIQTGMRDLARTALQLMRDGLLQFPKDKLYLTVITEIEKRLAAAPPGS